MTLDLKEEITKMRLDMGDQFQHLIASINRLREGFKSFREGLKESRCDHSFEKITTTTSTGQKALKNQSVMKTTKKREPTTELVKKPQRYFPGAVIVLETTRGIKLSTGGEKKPSRNLVSVLERFLSVRSLPSKRVRGW
ncbi:unnamed protein product [Brassica oleracea var. botrytis]|uniref:Uncharacterized protein n=2 Tax=Brassica TaxID=3705 RepID=A0A3P6CE74_BRAOL|nr:unnamed protein product [Brassica napus]VDD08865.1 unnamed protein product [Brassica oleracea]